MNQPTKPSNSRPSKPFVVAYGDVDKSRSAEATAALRGAVVAIGNFDGVHRGHKAVIGTAMARAARLNVPAAAFTFEPHPRVFLRPGDPLFRLSPEPTKLRLLAATGLDGAIVLNFNAGLAALSAADFITEILVGRFAISGAVIGFDFHFGHKRTGSPAFLSVQGQMRGFSVDVVPPLEDEGRPVSSGTIRTALEAGRVVEAAELIGHPWFVTGEVIHGDKRGRDLGFPTANIALEPGCGLKHGIYAVRVRVPEKDGGGTHYNGVASYGRRPMFDNGAALLEIFLFDFSGDLYGQTVDVALIGWIRPELRLDSIEALIARMHEDAAQAREILARTPDAFPPI